MQDKLNITSIDKIEYIFHMADIHIRLLDRHEEYKQIFEKIYEELRNTNKNTVVFLGGDIVHSKLEMTAELVDIVSDFFINLEKIRPVILIKGNHDLNVKNKKRMDVLSPIVKSLNLKNLFYINDFTKSYNFKNVDFYLYPFWSEENPTIIQNNNIKIGLYHDALNGSKSPDGFSLETKNTVSRFAGMDIVLLGDIHQYQIISKIPMVVYPGSLIQQDYGETIDGHGYVLWNLNNMSHKFVEIKNDYGFINFDFNTNNIDDINKKDIKYPSIKIKYSDKDKLLIDNLKTEIKKKYPNVLDILHEPNKSNKIISNVEKYKLDISSSYIELLRTFFEKENYEFEQIEEIHKEIFNLIDKKVKPKSNVWKPIKLKFSNMFSYGEDNYIDFENLNGSYGIFAPNTSGKSSIMEIINFVCFNKTSYTNQINKIVNIKKDTFEIIFIFENNNNLYKIQRSGKRVNDKFKLDINFYLIDNEENIIEDLTKTKNDIYKDLKEYLGEYDDFVLTALSLQGNKTNFIEKTQSERKELIQQFLEMDVFEKLYEISNTKTNKLSLELKGLNLKYQTYVSENLDKTQLDLTEELILLTSKKEEKQKESISLQSNILELSKTINENIILFDLEEIQKEVNINNKELEIVTQEINNLTNILNNKIEETIQLEEQHNNIILENYNENINILNTKMDILNDLRQSIVNTNKQLSKHNSLLFEDNCNACNNNIEILDIKNDKNNLDLLEKEKNILNEEINLLLDNLKVNTIDDYKKIYDNKQQLSQKIKENKNINSNIELKISLNESKKIILENKIKDNNTQLQETLKNKEIIINNKIIKENLNKLNVEYSLLNSSIESDTKLEIEIRTKLGIITNKIQEFDLLKEEINKKNKVQNKYSNYTHAVSKNGIPLTLINNVIQYIEDEVNLILENIVDFRLDLKMNDTNIETSISYNGIDKWDVSTISGMEKFITSLAIRIALINISQLPRPNFICIDEGFGVLDNNNLLSLKKLFVYLKEIFGFFIVISHIDIMREFVDNSIDINKNNGFSEIHY